MLNGPSRLEDVPTFVAQALPRRPDNAEPAVRRVVPLAVFPRKEWAIVSRVTTALGEERLLAIQHIASKRWRVAVNQLESQIEDLAPAAARLVAIRPTEHILIYPFPIDPLLPALRRAASPTHARATLAGHDQSPLRGTEITTCEVAPVRWVPGRRCQLGYTLRLRNGRRLELLGKVMRQRPAHRLDDVMRQASRIFARHAPARLVTPPSLALLPELPLVLQERMAGRTIHAALRQGTATAADVRDAAALIGVLHRGGLMSEHVHTLHDEVETVQTAARRLHDCGCGLPVLAPLVDRLRHALESCRVTRVVPVHRDFHDKQVLVHDSHAVLIDLDTVALGPPELDAANFLAHLRLRHRQGRLSDATAQAWTQVFLRAYAGESGIGLDTVVLQLLMVATYARLACVYRLRREGPRLAATMVAQAQELLAQTEMTS